MTVGPPEPDFDVALSFAGEQRDYVRAVASELTKNGIRVFFDEDNEIALWGKNLAEELQRIYMTASNVVVMFVSDDYARKSWPIHERQSAIARAINERREYILPARFDNTMLPGLDPSLSYLPLENRPPAKLAENIMAKLVQLGGRVEPPDLRSGRRMRATSAGTCAASSSTMRTECRSNRRRFDSSLQTARRTRAKQVPTALPTYPRRSAGPSRCSSRILNTVRRSTASTTTQRN